MDWARILVYVTGTVDQELLARNEYLAAENRILKAQLKGRLKLSDAERATLGEIGHHWAAVGPVGLDLEFPILAKEAGMHAVIVEARIGEIAQHRLLGGVLHGELVLR